MNIYRWCVYNPVTVNIMAVVIIVSGLYCSFRINAELFPEFSLDRVLVTVPYPGATPSEVEEGICSRVEEAIKDIEGIKEVTSSSSESIGVVVAEIETGEDVLYIKDKIKSAVDKITTFPEEAEEPVVTDLVMKRQVVNVALFADVSERSLKAMAERIEEEIREAKIGSDVVVQGLRNYEIAIEVSESTLRRFGLTFSELAMAIKRSSLDLPAGVIKTRSGEILIRTIGQKYTGREYEEVVVKANPDGSVVRLRDVARVIDGFEESDNKAFFNGKPSAILSVFKSERQDTIKVVKEVRKYVAERSKTLPAAFSMELFGDTSVLVQDRLDLLLRNGASGLALVFLTLAVFMDLRLAFWVSAGIPVSFLGTMVLLYFMGHTLNMISMFALIMALGIIVDDAIVVSEAVYKNMRDGMPPRRAAVEGLKEMLWPVMASVATTVVAFLPMVDIPGIMGKFIYVLPVSMISALLVSLLEALFILPSHLAHHVDVTVDENRITLLERFRRVVERILFGFIDNLYTPVLRFATEYRYITMAAGLAILFASVGLIAGGRVQLVFFPKMDSEVILANLTFPQGNPWEATHAAAVRVEKAAMALNETFRDQVKPGASLVKNIYTTVGQTLNMATGAGSSGSHLAMVYVELADLSKRSVKSEEINSKWRDIVGEIPGIESFETAGRQGGPGGKPIEVQLSGTDFTRLEAAAEYLKSRIEEYPGVYQVEDDLMPGKLEARIRFREGARTLGLTLMDLAGQVRQAFYGAEANRIQRGRDDVKVMVRYPEAGRISVNDILEMRVRTPIGGEVPFHDVATISIERGYSKISRTEGRRVIKVMAEVEESKANSNEVIADLNKSVVPEFRRLFSDVSLDYRGSQKDTRESMASLAVGFLIALLVIFGILATVFQSYIQPFIICFAIPLGLVGAILGHWVNNIDMAMMSLFGMVALAGIVVNNSIILIDFINIRVSEGMPLEEAVMSSGRARFRPILVTTLTTVAGLLPLMLENNFQAQFLIPMAISISYGLMFSTLLTLIYTPAMVMIFHDIRSLLCWVWTGEYADHLVDELRLVHDELLDAEHRDAFTHLGLPEDSLGGHAGHEE